MKIEQELGFGLWEVKDGDLLTREIRDVDAFRAAIGDDLTVGFAQLFTAVGRLDALLCLMGINNARSSPIIDGHPDTAHDPASISASRNRNLIGVFIWGVFHELFAAVETLQAGGLTAVLRSRKDRMALASWKKLRSTAHKWRQNLEQTVRNQLAFHLGDRDVMRVGLVSWPKDRPLVFSTADGTARMNAQFHTGFDLLCHALGITDVDVDRLAKQGVEDRNVADDAMNVFFGTLYAKGADIPSPTAMRAHRGQEGTETK